MPNQPTPEVKPRAISPYVFLAAGLFVFIITFKALSPIFLSALLIFVISLALSPVVSWMRAWVGGRRVATGLIVLALVVVIGLTGWAFFVPMRASVISLTENLPSYWERLQKPLIRMEKQAVLSEEKLQAEVTTELAEEKSAAGEPEAAERTVASAPPEAAQDAGSIRTRIGEMAQGVFGRFAAAAFNLAQILIVFVTVFFGVVFTLMDPRPILGAMFSLVPAQYHAKTLTILKRMAKFAPGWAGSTLLGMLTIGVLVFLLMWPILGFMDALVLGLIAGILEAVPYIGPILSAVPGLLLALGQGGLTPLWVLLAYCAIQALENNVIFPFIMARGMKLHPVAVIFSMLLCVAAFGVLGVLVASPLVAIFDILHDELYRKRFLSEVTDADLDRLARQTLREKVSDGK